MDIDRIMDYLAEQHEALQARIAEDELLELSGAVERMDRLVEVAEHASELRKQHPETEGEDMAAFPLVTALGLGEEAVLLRYMVLGPERTRDLLVTIKFRREVEQRMETDDA